MWGGVVAVSDDGSCTLHLEGLDVFHVVFGGSGLTTFLGLADRDLEVMGVWLEVGVR